MKTDLRGKGILCESEEHGQAIKKYFQDNGVSSIDLFEFNEPGNIYIVNYVNGYSGLYKKINPYDFKSGIEIIELPESYWPIKEEKTFPRMMEVSDDIRFPETHNLIYEVLFDLGEEYRYRFVVCPHKDNEAEVFRYAREIEEKKEPLFVTEDGEKIFDSQEQQTYCVAEGTRLEKLTLQKNEGNHKDLKYFFHKENAIKYIQQRDWKEGELYLVKNGNRWIIRYSSKEYANFYYGQTKSGRIYSNDNFVKCPEGFELPKE